MTDQEIGWLAGLFEGEGTAGVYERNTEVNIAMTDADVINRVQALFPSPLGITSRKRSEKHKTIYLWRLRRRDDMAAFLTLIFPLLGERRKAQVSPVIQRASDPKGGLGSGHRRKTHCPHGHPYNKENTRVNDDGHRACRTCSREQTRARRARLRSQA